METIYSGTIKRMKFTIACGDIFDAPVNAIVNSEETSFILAGNPNSISGQINLRFGEEVQSELDELTRGEVFSRGTVLVTGAVEKYQRIFHAGFHEPWNWPGMPGCTEDADYFEAIGSCVRQILQRAKEEEVGSVAFPLIGCGTFGLDERMLLFQFLDALEACDDSSEASSRLHVWLVIRRADQMQSIVSQFIEVAMAARRSTDLLPER